MSQQSPTTTSSPAPSPWPVTNVLAPNGAQQRQQGEPPAKRPRLSPPPPSSSPSPYPTPPQYPSSSTPQTPYISSTAGFRYPQLPQNAFPPRAMHMPTSAPMTNGTPPVQPPATSVMGPPQRPVERATPAPTPVKEEREANFDAINDVALSSGIDITKEEDLLRYRSRPSSHYDTQSGGFGLGDRGTFGQTPEQSQKDQLLENHSRAARKAAEQQAEHLNNPFLLGNVLRYKLTTMPKRDFNLNVATEGLWDQQDRFRQRENTGMSMTHARDGSSIVSASMRAPFSVEKGAPLEPMMALLSLAGHERLRSLLEDAYGFARARQITADGIVPPEWSDIATNSNIEAENATTNAAAVTDSSWDRPPTPPPGDAENSQQATKAFAASKNPIVTALTLLTRQDREAEEARLKRRAERKARRVAETAESVAASITNGVASERGGTPVQDGLRMTKKERDKLARADLSEEAATRNANTTAQMQLGGKSYSWMSGGSKKKTQAKPVSSSSSGGTGPAKSSAGHAASGPKPNDADSRTTAVGQDCKFGIWREDSVGGKGVQMRDWVAVLEVDGHEKKTLESARVKLGREDTGL